MSSGMATSYEESETIKRVLSDSGGTKRLVASFVTVIRLLDLHGVLLYIYTCKYHVDKWSGLI